MARRKPEQIVRILHEADGALATGKTVEEFCREKQVSTATYYRWKKKYAKLSVPDIKRLKALEAENEKLKRMLADALLANDALKEFLAKKG